jgi:hypothetical protein
MNKMAGITKQHFKAIASIISRFVIIDKEAPNDDPYKYFINEGMDFINELCDYFKTQNPLFNKERFLKACLE